ncbi:MAG: SAM-dependent chlorinase/fluorinase [bacterium]|nr:SAM-dependent chlorinase/fluorinase [bacterium]
MPRAAPHIALLTDFGTAAGYAGVLHGVLACRCPSVRITDLAHSIPRHNIAAAAYVLWVSYRFFPPQTVFLCVVDPGVGTARSLLAVRVPHGPAFVAPDNGLLAYVLSDIPEAQGVCIQPTRLGVKNPSQTFHGRDILAPAAAALAQGAPLHHLGTPCPLAERAIPPVCAPPNPQRTWHPARVLYADYYGNLITDVPLSYSVQRFRYGRRLIARSVRAYADAPPATLCFLPGSAGRWEIALREGSAKDALGVEIGAPLTFSLAHPLRPQ